MNIDFFSVDPGHISRSFPSFHEFPSSAVKSLLSALKLNSYEARVFFPRLLQIVAAYPDIVTTFVQCVSCLFIGRLYRS